MFLFCPDDDAPALKASCSLALISRASDLVCLVEMIYHVLPSPGSLCIYPVQIRYFNSPLLLKSFNVNVNALTLYHYILALLASF